MINTLYQNFDIHAGGTSLTFLQSKHFFSFVKKPPDHYILTENHFSDYQRMQLSADAIIARAIIGASDCRRSFPDPGNSPLIGHCLYYIMSVYA